MSISAKPNIFIGSSREAIDIANAVHSQLNYYGQVSPWYAGAFGGNEYTMETLERELEQHDFGIFVFAPDDVALHRGKYVFVPRDNTLFEMGLFWGKLGRSRVFAVIPGQVRERSDLIEGKTIHEFHVLSDLQGLTLLSYELRTDNKHEAAVSVACQQLIRRIKEEGFFQNPRDLLAAKETELLQKQSLLHFFWEYTRNLAAVNSQEKYEALYEAVRNSIMAPQGFRVTGAALWRKQGLDGIGQVAGNVGRGQFFSFSAAERRQDKDHQIYVIDVFLNGKWSFFKREELALVYVLCYPLGREHVLSVHFAGQRLLEESELAAIVQLNNDLLRTIDHLIGGDSA